MVVQNRKYLKEKESCLHKILHDDILLTDLQAMFR